ncbi:SDR family NAD(P)-dependent oxidoreductase [Sneathiella aquimaris]|uniref:SDR family NAD(P)-dependent oxidoreductase n=1 Tax=Sneathiella aquimaris TaxID=2599305 RepID=UPI00146DBDDD|nr:SDR family NAD(P)-dependent oxidoreductase [Sneathiella aquimaris]
MPENIVIIGTSGAIGSAFTRRMSALHPASKIHAFSQSSTPTSEGNITYHPICYADEASIQDAASLAAETGPLDTVIVATGLLHEGDIRPEKSLKDLSAKKFMKIFEANTITPSLLAKHFIPKLNRDNKATFAAISARVGSISDNRLGGWYAYRASKAALNMILKNAALETARRNKNAVIIGLHPGTVDTDLSKPFQANVPSGKLFTPDFAATKMLKVLDSLSPQHSGKIFAWDGQEISP